MSKKLLIKNVKLLKESKDIDIPMFIQKVFQTRKHTLGDNPIFPDSEEITYEEKVLKKRFNELKDNLVKLGLNPKEEQLIKDVFTDSIKKCLVIEKTNSDNLTEIALTMIKNIFSIPENILINANLGELKENLLNEYPTDYEIEFENTNRIKEIHKEIYKRRVVNAMIQGLSSNISTNLKTILPELYETNPSLLDLYSKIMNINSYLTFIQKGSEGNSNAGVVFVGISKEPITIEAYGLILPVLLFELSKGVLELFSSHALPENVKEASYILAKADFAMAESWDQRLGVPIWDNIEKFIPVTKKDLKYDLFYSLVNLPVDDFNSTLKEILSDTKEGKNKVLELLTNIENELQEKQFNDTITKNKTQYKENFLGI